MSIEKPGWYSRGYLPHFDAPNKVQFITFHLADSLPASALDRINDEILLLTKEKQEMERRRKLEKWLDQGHGACWLGRPEIARFVDAKLQSEDGDRYLLLGWCIMPNHVHVLAEFSDDELVWNVVKGWKGATAVEANRTLGRSGSF